MSIRKFPTPKYVIFYNGTQDEPERVELCLSDAFEEKDQEAALECRALILNINYGHNKELMKKCKRLEDYAYFIQSVRKYLAEGSSLERAAELAISECIEKDILADILCQNREEVLNLLLTVYDKKLHEKTLCEEGREEGRILVLIDLVKDNSLSIEKAAAKANMSVEQFKEEMEKVTFR